MIKFLVSLATFVTSFISLFSINSSAVATPLFSSELNQANNRNMEQPISLNSYSSLWQLGDRDSKEIFDHLGCSCAACSKTSEVEVKP
ncbi:MAG: hypothetical protein AAGE84_17515 [Cyanobacteria bacterium P01_G01_bin.39]